MKEVERRLGDSERLFLVHESAQQLAGISERFRRITMTLDLIPLQMSLELWYF